jgi:alpha-L-fucosidase
VPPFERHANHKENFVAAKQISAKGLDQFFDNRFGMFIHWGLYAIMGRSARESLAEWVMYGENISVPEYEKLVPQFNPVKFNADEWVSIAADAGQKYMIFTSRHHDGFSMYDTALSDYKVTNSPFGRDPLEELANACARRGDVKLGMYSSLMDWHHPAYRFREESGLAWSDYLDFLHGQVRELCTNYGEIAGIWFDGDWPHHEINETNAYFVAGGSFEYDKLYDMIHTLQPDAYVHNNRHEEPLPGEDVQGFEQDLPGENSTGFNTTTVYDMPIEVCMTINDNWGFHAMDDDHKSTQRLLNNLIRSASMNANYLLNVGPTAEGVILPVHVARLRAMGAWLDVNGEAIHGARAGVVSSPSGVSTRKGDTHYVHALRYDSDRIYLEGLPESVQQASLLSDGSALELKSARKGRYVTVPAEKRDALVTVVKLQ